MYFAYFAYIGAYGPYANLYFQSIGQSAQAIGVLGAIAQGMRIVAPNFWAWIADRAGARLAVLQISLALSIVCFAGLFVTTSFVGIALVLTMHAFCAGGVNPLVEAITLTSLRDAVARYGAIRLWGSVGFILAVLGVGYQLDAAAPATLLVAVLALMIASLAVAMALPRGDATSAAQQTDIGPILRRREVVALLVACFFMNVAHGPLYQFYTIFLAAHGYSTTAIGALWSLGVLAEIAVFWFMPRWLGAGRIGPILVLSFACAVVRFLLVGWAVDTLLVQIGAQILHGATFGSYHACALALVHRWFGEGARARGQAIYSSVSFGAGGVGGALGSGALWEPIGAAWTFTLGAVFAALGLLVLAAQRRIASW
jgi:PPP family 3-phenylpropionic acid transporter